MSWYNDSPDHALAAHGIKGRMLRAQGRPEIYPSYSKKAKEHIIGKLQLLDKDAKPSEVTVLRQEIRMFITEWSTAIQYAKPEMKHKIKTLIDDMQNIHNKLSEYEDSSEDEREEMIATAVKRLRL